MGFFRSMFRSEDSSKQVAKDRLRLVLVQDRISLSAADFEALKEELLQVISKYMDIDDSGVEVNVQRDGDAAALIATVPVKRTVGAASGPE